MAMPQPNARAFAYYRRKANRLGDDLAADFEPPIYFLGVFSDVAKEARGFGSALFSNSASHIETYDLELTSCEIKKDDRIIPCYRGMNGEILPSSGRQWNVNSAQVLESMLRVASDDEEDNQRRSPKILEVQ